MTVHRAIFWLHLLTGTLAGLVILVMSVTGVLLAFEPQIVDDADDAKLRGRPAGSMSTQIECLMFDVHSR